MGYESIDVVTLGWPISAIAFVFLFCVPMTIHKHTKLERKQRQNDARLWRYESSKITICLIQREVISKIKGFGLRFRPFKMRVLNFLVVFLSFDVNGYRVT